MTPRRKRLTLSEQVKNELMEHIRTLTGVDDCKLPSEDHMAERYGVSRVTIRRALSDLEQQGVVYRRHGYGTFVNARFIQINVTCNVIHEFERMIRSCGYDASVRHLNSSIISGDTTLSTQLQLSPKDEILRNEKMFYADDHPAIYCIDYLPCKYLKKKNYTEEDLVQSTFAFLREQSGRIIERDVLRISVADSRHQPEFKTYFGCEDYTSYLKWEALLMDQTNRPALLSINYFDTNFVSFTLFRNETAADCHSADEE